MRTHSLLAVGAIRYCFNPARPITESRCMTGNILMISSWKSSEFTTIPWETISQCDYIWLRWVSPPLGQSHFRSPQVSSQLNFGWEKSKLGGSGELRPCNWESSLGWSPEWLWGVRTPRNGSFSGGAVKSSERVMRRNPRRHPFTSVATGRAVACADGIAITRASLPPPKLPAPVSAA